jgi:hypothetical protein
MRDSDRSDAAIDLARFKLAGTLPQSPRPAGSRRASLVLAFRVIRPRAWMRTADRRPRRSATGDAAAPPTCERRRCELKPCRVDFRPARVSPRSVWVHVALTVVCRPSSRPRPRRGRRGRGPVAGRRVLRWRALPEEDLAQCERARGDARLHRADAEPATDAERAVDVPAARVGTLRAPLLPSYRRPAGPQLPTSRSTWSPAACRPCAASWPRSCG